MKDFLDTMVAILIYLLLIISPYLIVVTAAVLLATFVSGWFMFLLILVIPALALSIAIVERYS